MDLEHLCSIRAAKQTGEQAESCRVGICVICSNVVYVVGKHKLKRLDKGAFLGRLVAD